MINIKNDNYCNKTEKSLFITFISFILLFGSFILLCIYDMNEECKKDTYPIYEFIDLDGNVKEGVDCSYKFEHNRAGGQGSPVCLSGDGAYTMVKQYKIVRYTKQPYCNKEVK